MAAIAPNSSYANHFQGWIAMDWDGDYEAAARFYERAIADDPYTPQPILRKSAVLLSKLGRFNEAEVLLRALLARDPACVACTNNLARIMRFAGKHSAAAETIEGILEWQEPNHSTLWNIGVAWLVAGDPERALDYFDRLQEFDPGLARFGRIFALYDLGLDEQFDAAFEAYQAELSQEINDGTEGIARIHAWTGAADKALELTQKNVEAEGPGFAKHFTTDMYGRIAADPRYQAFLEQYGANEEALTNIEFNPVYPPEIRAALALSRNQGAE